MGLKYRWTQKQDLKKIGLDKDKNIKSLLKSHRTVANVVELENDILGFVIYNISKNNLDIISIYYDNKEAFDFIIDKITNKFNYPISIEVSEYNLDLHILLKSKNFLAKSIEKTAKEDFYKFEFNGCEK